MTMRRQCRCCCWILVAFTASLTVVTLLLEDDISSIQMPTASHTIQKWMRDSEQGNFYLCEWLSQLKNANATTTSTASTLPHHLQYTDLRCSKSYGRGRLGNFLARWYLTRVIAAKANVTLSGGICSNSVTEYMNYIKINPIATRQHLSPTFSVVSWQDMCRICISNDTSIRDQCVYPHGDRNLNNSIIGLEPAIPLIQEDMQRLANNVLIYSTFDDIAIHVRIGDIGQIFNSRYGLVPFRVYRNYIPSHFAGTIGLITAPFAARRGKRPNNAAFNEAVITAAQDYLQGAFPHAVVRIRNDPAESHAQVYARLLRAKLLICAPSTYCLIPALGRINSTETNTATNDITTATMIQQHRTIVIQSKLFGFSSTDGQKQQQQHWLNRYVEYVKEPLLTSTQMQDLNASTILQKLSKELPPKQG